MARLYDGGCGMKFNGQYRIESTRLPYWDYAAPGAYFVTICIRRRSTMAFGGITNGIMTLSPLGAAARTYWEALPNHFPNATLDEYVIMPDHVHGVVIIQPSDAMETRHPLRSATGTDGASLPETPNSSNTPRRTFGPLQKHSLSVMLNQYKAAITRWARTHGDPDFGWQARFYDRLLQGARTLEIVRRYIRNNPANWMTQPAGPARNSNP